MDLITGKSSKKNLLQNPAKMLADKFSKSGYELHQYNFANGLENDKDNTLLVPALTDLAKKHDFSKVKGILLVSDGWLRDESLQQALQLGCPFYAIADTQSIAKADLRVANTVTNRHAYRGEPTLIRAEVRSENYTGPATVKLMLSGKPIATQTVSLKAGSPANVDFTQRFAQTGFYPYSVEVSASGIKERSQNNNSYPGAIDVLSDKQQVVILSDSPAWDNKFIMDTLTENSRWEVSHYRIDGIRLFQGEKLVNSLPDANLAAVVLINNGGLQLSGASLSYVVNSHQKGVGILFQGLPLAELNGVLPLQRSNVLSSYQGFLQLTSAAATYPMLSFDGTELQQIPPLDYYYVTATKTSEVLATMNNPQNSPAIAIQNTSSGKVFAMAFLNLWKWQMQSESGSYKKLLSDCIIWLANKTSSGYNAIYNTSYFLGEEIALRLRAENDIRSLRLDLNPEIKVFNADNKEVFSDFLTQSEGEYAVKLDIKKPGQYRFEIKDKVSKESSSGRFNVVNSSIEARDFDFNIPLLSWLTNDTGGKLLTLNSVKDFTPLPAQSRKLELRLDIPIYRKWYVLGMFILAFCLELLLRRRWGLL